MLGENIFSESNNNEYGNNINSTRRLNTIQNETDINDVINWVNENKFLMTVMSLTSVIIISFILNWIHSVVKRGACRCKKQSDIKITPGMKSIINKYRSSGYTNFFVKILLVGYCNICTITNYQLVHFMDSNMAVGFIVICFVIFEIGFPFYIARLLNDNSTRLNSPEFRKRYSALYENYNDSSRDNKFIIIVLLKQLAYSILVNISNNLTVLQNTLILVVNIAFMFTHSCHSPYKEGLYYIQALLMSFSTIAISVINYMFIIEGVDLHLIQFFTIISTSIHVLTFGSFFIIQILRFCKKRSKMNFKQKKHGQIEMSTNNPLFLGQQYLHTDKPKRFSNVISDELISVED